MKFLSKLIFLLFVYSSTLFFVVLLNTPLIFLATIIGTQMQKDGNEIGIYLMYGSLLFPIILLSFLTYKELKKSIVDLLNESLEADNENVEFYIIDSMNFRDSIDKKIFNYIRDIKNKLNYKKDVLIIRGKNSQMLNAFAISNFSGEAVVVYDGVLNCLNEGEIKAVLGHEFGHLKNRDSLYKIAIYSINYVYPYLDNINIKIINTLGKIQYINILALAFMLYDAILKFLYRFLLNPINTIMLQFSSRQAEFLADKIGAKVTSPKYMINALKKISDMEIENKETLLMKILSTHPSTKKRISYLEKNKLN